MAIEVRPITATLGAEISGVDMADVSGETLEQLRKAWLDHKVLVLRDQHISVEEHIAFGRRFGDLEVHPFAVGKKGYPEVVKIKSTAEHLYAQTIGIAMSPGGPRPSMGSILRGVVIPPAGGDTCFADAGAAYQRLSQEWKDQVDPLFAIHDFSMTSLRAASLRRGAGREAGALSAGSTSRYPHPSRDRSAHDLHQPIVRP